MALQLSSTNGGAVADATDSFDMMDKLIDFLDGTTAGETGKLLPVGQRWTVNKDDTSTVPGERHVYLEGPGLSGTDAIFVNIRIYSVIPNNIHNWEIRGSTGFSGSLAVDDQPGGSTVESYLTLSNTTMPFWFVVSGRRIIIVAQTAGSVSYACYLGWYLPYATPTEFPYPMFNGGSTSEDINSYLLTNYKVGNFYDCPRHASTVTKATSQIRHVDGSWLHVAAYNQTTSATRPNTDTSIECNMWPHDRNATDYELKLIENPDGTFPIFPFILYSDENGGNVYGELDGIHFSPLGTAGKKFPDTITVGGDTYLVINNAYRTLEANAALLLK